MCIRRLYTICVALLLACTAAGQSFDRGEVPTPTILAIFDGLLTRSFRQQARTEVAAFLVQNDQGEIKCYLWPYDDRSLAHSFRGKRPAGAVAIAHTHPEGFGTKPSAADRITSRATHLPVFVITLREIQMFDPAIGETVKVSDGDWRKGVGRQSCLYSSVWRAEKSIRATR